MCTWAGLYNWMQKICVGLFIVCAIVCGLVCGIVCG